MDKSIVDRIGQAYRTEIEGHVFYGAAAEMIKDALGKNVFTHLAKEELDHIKALSIIADSLEKGLGWVSYDEALKVQFPKGAPIFPKTNELIERLNKSQTDLNALAIGIEIEDAAVDFYVRLLRDAGTPNEKVAITQILEMEKNHLKILRWEEESLKKNGFWCGDLELSVEKEADA